MAKTSIEVVGARQKLSSAASPTRSIIPGAMDHVWRCHLEGKPHGYDTRRPEDCPPLNEIRDSQRALDDWFIEYANTLTPESESEAIKFEFIGGCDGRMTRSEILFHVVNHGTYHREHISTMMYEADLEPPTTDYLVYAWVGDFYVEN